MNAAVPPELAAAGVTYRMLDHWVRRGYLRPDDAAPGSGHRRQWPRPELAVALTMAHLVRAGVDPADAAAAARRSRPVRGPVRVAGRHRRRSVQTRLSNSVTVRVTA